MRLLYLLAQLFFIMSCRSAPPSVQKEAKEDLAVGVYEAPVPLEDRIYYAGEKELAFLIQWNKRHDQSVRAAEEDSDFIINYKKAVNSLPASIQEVMKKRIAAVVVAQGLDVSATAIKVAGDSQRGVIFIDIVKANVKANDFMNKKETMPFSQENGVFPVKIQVSTAKQDSVALNLQMSLIHELGHIISWDSEIGFSGGNTLGSAHSPYFDESWDLGSSKPVHSQLPENAFMNKVRFYYDNNNKIPLKELPDVYRELASSNFVNLYSSINPPEDFAESFGLYVHTEVLKQPFITRVKIPNQKDLVIKACWQEGRCAGKARVLAAELRRIGI